MSGLKPITINDSPEKPANIYAEDDAAIYQSIFGEDGVSSIGEHCKATLLSNNKIRIADGVLCVGGHFARIPFGDYVDCEIMNGKSGKKRNDLIVAKFSTTGSGGIDTMELNVIQGTSGESGTDPEVKSGNLYKEEKIREVPLYRVRIEGLNIIAVEPMFEIMPTNEELRKKLDELSQKGAKVISKDDFGIVIDTGHSHVRFGTSVRPTAKDGTGNRYVRLWSAAEIANLLKVPKIEAHNFDLSIRNGDSTSNPVHFYTPEYWNDGNFYAYTWLGSDGNVRVDYRMEYPTIGL